MYVCQTTGQYAYCLPVYSYDQLASVSVWFPVFTSHRAQTLAKCKELVPLRLTFKYSCNQGTTFGKSIFPNSCCIAHSPWSSGGHVHEDSFVSEL